MDCWDLRDRSQAFPMSFHESFREFPCIPHESIRGFLGFYGDLLPELSWRGWVNQFQALISDCLAMSSGLWRTQEEPTKHWIPLPRATFPLGALAGDLMMSAMIT